MAYTIDNILNKVTPNAKPQIAQGVAAYLKMYGPQFGVNTPARIAAFLAQGAHETAGFRSLKEWPKKGMIAGQQYEGRKDLGNTVPGDGIKFAGRGIFQTTGRYNYAVLSKKLFSDDTLINKPELLELPQYAVLSALHYWNDKNLNAYADRGDTVTITRKINGGTNGLDQRLKYYSAFSSIIAINPALFLGDFLKKKIKLAGSSLFNNSFVADIRFFFTGE